jgi:hypothetical protein
MSAMMRLRWRCFAAPPDGAAAAPKLLGDAGKALYFKQFLAKLPAAGSALLNILEPDASQQISERTPVIFAP